MSPFSIVRSRNGWPGHDASIMPDDVRANTNVTTMMIGGMAHIAGGVLAAAAGFYLGRDLLP